MEWNWNDTSITLTYSKENLKNLLELVCKKENRFSHYELSKWCDNLAMTFEDDEFEDWNDEIALTAHIARDIECQWDLFLINTYSLKQLQIMDFSKVELPLEWFIEWKKELN